MAMLTASPAAYAAEPALTQQHTLSVEGSYLYGDAYGTGEAVGVNQHGGIHVYRTDGSADFLAPNNGMVFPVVLSSDNKTLYTTDSVGSALFGFDMKTGDVKTYGNVDMWNAKEVRTSPDNGSLAVLSYELDSDLGDEYNLQASSNMQIYDPATQQVTAACDIGAATGTLASNDRKRIHVILNGTKPVLKTVDASTCSTAGTHDIVIGGVDATQFVDPLHVADDGSIIAYVSPLSMHGTHDDSISKVTHYARIDPESGKGELFFDHPYRKLADAEHAQAYMHMQSGSPDDDLPHEYSDDMMLTITDDSGRAVRSEKLSRELYDQVQEYVKNDYYDFAEITNDGRYLFFAGYDRKEIFSYDTEKDTLTTLKKNSSREGVYALSDDGRVLLTTHTTDGEGSFNHFGITAYSTGITSSIEGPSAAGSVGRTVGIGITAGAVLVVVAAVAWIVIRRRRQAGSSSASPTDDGGHPPVPSVTPDGIPSGAATVGVTMSTSPPVPLPTRVDSKPSVPLPPRTGHGVPPSVPLPPRPGND
ncbi:hypothetical protein [Bifidobacterium stellenboschense]|uniref:hypothetical protein n=1 Tax=Bifidobacterium stellenboschense TaxID=762211 RepID=UPI00138E2005|nr:hypothetical protein [Bifidobacterium stellenboschense]